MLKSVSYSHRSTYPIRSFVRANILSFHYYHYYYNQDYHYRSFVHSLRSHFARYSPYTEHSLLPYSPQFIASSSLSSNRPLVRSIFTKPKRATMSSGTATISSSSSSPTSSSSSLSFSIDPSIPLPVNSTLEHPFDPLTVQESIEIIVLEVPSVSVSYATSQLKNVLLRNTGKLRYAISSLHDPHNRTVRWLLLKPEVVSSVNIDDITDKDTREKLRQYIHMIETTYTRSPSSSLSSSSSNTTIISTTTSTTHTPSTPTQPFKVSIFRHRFVIPYEDLTTETALLKLLPSAALQYNSGHIPCSFEIAGHLAHINLREELAPWRFIIGRVILDKNPVLRTVVNKIGNIENTFRTFPMEIIAGENSTLVDMRHSNAQFAFDFREVYWNSRLQTEHDTLVQTYIPPGSIVADMFCGVGPFTVPLGMDPHNCTVYGNDLNPSSIAALIVNMYRNRKAIGCKTFVSGSQQRDIDNLDFANILKDTRIRPHNMDARDFIRYLVQKKVPFQHAIMNLPADGLEFCDVFVGYYRHGEEQGNENANTPNVSSLSSSLSTYTLPLPRIHVYCFSRADNETEAADDVTQRLLHILQIPPIPAMEEEVTKQREERQRKIDNGIWQPHSSSSSSSVLSKDERYKEKDTDEILSKYVVAVKEQKILPDLAIRVVRNVAPGKLMMCASYTLPYTVAIKPPIVKYSEPIVLPPSMDTVYAQSKTILHKLNETNHRLEQHKKEKESKIRTAENPNNGNDGKDERLEPRNKRSKGEE